MRESTIAQAVLKWVSEQRSADGVNIPPKDSLRKLVERIASLSLDRRAREE